MKRLTADGRVERMQWGWRLDAWSGCSAKAAILRMLCVIGYDEEIDC